MSTTTAVRERGILFSGEMVRAILDGRKTQTRRVIKPQPHQGIAPGFYRFDSFGRNGEKAPQDYFRRVSPYQPGQILWVREGWQDVHPFQVADGRYSQEGRAGIPGPPPVTYRTIYRADGPYPPVYYTGEGHPYRRLTPQPGHLIQDPAEMGYVGWCRSISMPRWASRLTLEIVSVRVERLQAITEEDAFAEGFGGEFERDPDREQHEKFPSEMFRDLWDGINGKREGCSWAADPWVWVVEFRPVEDR